MMIKWVLAISLSAYVGSCPAVQAIRPQTLQLLCMLHNGHNLIDVEKTRDSQADAAPEGSSLSLECDV